MQTTYSIHRPFGQLQAIDRTSPFGTMTEEELKNLLDQDKKDELDINDEPDSKDETSSGDDSDIEEEMGFALTLYDEGAIDLEYVHLLHVMTSIRKEHMLPPLDLCRVIPESNDYSGDVSRVHFEPEDLNEADFLNHFLPYGDRTISTVYLVVGKSRRLSSFFPFLKMLSADTWMPKVVIVWWLEGSTPYSCQKGFRAVVVLDLKSLKSAKSLEYYLEILDREFINCTLHSWLADPLLSECVAEALLPYNNVTWASVIREPRNPKILWEVDENVFPIPEKLRDRVFPTILHTRPDFDFSYAVSKKLKRLHVTGGSVLLKSKNVESVQDLRFMLNNDYTENMSYFLAKSYSNLDTLVICGDPTKGLTIYVELFPKLRHLKLQDVSSQCELVAHSSVCQLLSTLLLVNCSPKLTYAKGDSVGDLYVTKLQIIRSFSELKGMDLSNVLFPLKFASMYVKDARKDPRGHVRKNWTDELRTNYKKCRRVWNDPAYVERAEKSREKMLQTMKLIAQPLDERKKADVAFSLADITVSDDSSD